MPKHLVLALALLLTLSFSISATGQNALSDRDSLILIDLWNTTGGSNWTAQWITDFIDGETVLTPAYAWPGVIVRNSVVDRLFLARAGLVGMIPESLAGLTSPRTILLSGNSGNFGNLHGPIPVSLSAINSLEQLSLGSNNLTGGIPEELGFLPNLTDLSLARNPLGGTIPKTLGSLLTLQDLQLGEAKLQGKIPTELDSLISLRTLNLLGNDLEGPIPPSFWKLASLQVLQLNQNRLSGKLPPELGKLSNLLTLNLSLNDFTGPIPDAWDGMTSLQQMILDQDDLEGPIPEKLGSLSNMTWLSLALNRFSGVVPESFKQLGNLTTLNLNDNDLDGLPDLSGLAMLTRLQVQGNRLTFEHLEPNAGFVGKPDVTFRYAPQDSVETMIESDDGQVTVSVSVGGEKTEYRWFRDDEEIEEATESEYLIPEGETGSYRAEATNPLLPDLTLHSLPISGTVLVVNSVKDTPRKADAPEGICDTGEIVVTKRQDEPECTLWAAIETVNAQQTGKTAGVVGAVTILIDIFEENDEVPVIAAPKDLHVIKKPAIINGLSQPGAGRLHLDGGGRANYGFRLQGSNIIVKGVIISGFLKDGIIVTGNRARIERCWLLGNEEAGIRVVGDQATITKSVVSSNKVGIWMEESDKSIIHDNWIGTDDDAATPLPNQFGILAAGGDDNEFTNNVISSNKSAGLFIGRTDDEEERFPLRNKVIGNYIGTNAASNPSLGNGGFGARLVADRSTVKGNLISGNHGDGLQLLGSDNDVLNNNIGTTRGGRLRLKNEGHGILMERGRVSLKDNTISGNTLDGVRIESGFEGSTIQGNKIGTDRDGESDLPNDAHGIVVEHIGSIEIVDNVISGNKGGGIEVDRCRTKVEIKSNKIGTNISGTVPLGNGGNGLEFVGGCQRFSVVRNTISANGQSGIVVSEAISGLGVISENKIGTAVDGKGLDDRMANKKHGVHIHNGNDVFISGDNHISFNIDTGILIESSSDVRVIDNVIRRNTDGIGIIGGEHLTIRDNRIAFNDRNINALDALEKIIIKNNYIAEGEGTGTGLHLTNSQAIIEGNHFTDDAGDAITLEDGSTATITNNNFTNNAGFGVNNLDQSIVVVATGNWWGDPSGPSGSGPGIGDAVSTSVDFSDWSTGPVSIVVSTQGDVIDLPAGETDTLSVFAQNWVVRDDILDLEVSDEQGWLQSEPAFSLTLEDSMSAEAVLSFSIPAGIPDGTESAVQLVVTSQSDPTDADTTTFTVVAKTVSLVSLFVAPDSVTVAEGDTVRFEAFGFDQFGRAATVLAAWSATGGSIDNEGVFIAGADPGTYTVTATVGGSQLEAVSVVSIVSTVGVEEEELPVAFQLKPNYPNPFNPSTMIGFSVPQSTHTRLAVYDMLGRRVALLVDEMRAAGNFEVRFDASRFPSGVYFYRMSAGDFQSTRTMLLVR